MKTTGRVKAFVVAGMVLPILPAVTQSQLFAKPLPSDSRIHTGTLPNGVTWMYRQHDNPPGKMALMLHVKTGSLNETEKQRGLAHFIEHMCFNGTKNFPPGKLIPYFESIGMEFGADLNAFTSFDQTAYMLFTPDTKTEQIDKALLVLSDYAFRASLLPVEIDKERGVVLEEARSGKNAFQRIRDKLWPRLFEGARFAKRLPIGDEEILKTAMRDQFVDYYRTWYRPENMTVVLVGDAEPDRIIPLIKKRFGRFNPSTASRKAEGPEFKMFTKQRAMVVTDPEMAFCNVVALNLRPGRPPTVTTEQWRTELVERIGSWIIGRRFDERVKKGKASFRRANASANDFFHDAVLVQASANGEPQDWSKMIQELVTEVHRAREFGFTKRELELAEKEMLADAQHAVKTEPTRNARGMIMQIVFSVNDETPVLSAHQELDLLQDLFPSIQLSEVNDSFKKNFTPGAFAYVIQMVKKEGVTVPKEGEVLAAARAAWSQEIQPIEEAAAPTQLLSSLPKMAKVAQVTKDNDLGITSAWLENGVRVHHRYMDYKKDSVWVSIALAGGRIEENTSNAGITDVAVLAVNEAATHRLTSSNIRDLMTGKNIHVSANGQGDAFTIMVTGAPEDLEVGLQEVHALLTDGKIEESAFKNWKLMTLQGIKMRETMPMFKAFEGLLDVISGGDPRLMFATEKTVNAQSLAAAQKWFERLCREAPIEVAVVGDISLEKALPLIQRYLGSLPQRSRKADRLDKLRKLGRETGPYVQRVPVETVTPQAMTIAGFIGCEARHISDRRALSLAANILSSKLVKRIREDLSIVYSIAASSRPSQIYEDAGQFGAGAPCDPKNAEQVADEIHKLFKDFVANGPSAEELKNAKKQIAENLDTQMREPTYWLGVLRQLDQHHRSLQEQKKEKEAFEQFTGAQVQSVFKKYNTANRRFRVIAIPTLAQGGDQNKEKKEPGTP